MINLKDYIKAKKIENKKLENERKKEYKENIRILEGIVINAILDKRTYFDLRFTSNLVKITDKLYFDKECDGSWEYRIKMNLLSLWLLKKEVKKVNKW